MAELLEKKDRDRRMVVRFLTEIQEIWKEKGGTPGGRRYMSAVWHGCHNVAQRRAK